MNNAAATFIGAIVIALAILFASRWEMTSSPQVHLLDRWTGTVVACALKPGTQTLPAEYNCRP